MKDETLGANPALDMGAIEKYSDLLIESARLRILKRRAVHAEDFVEASRLKRQEAEVGIQLRGAIAVVSGEGDPAERKRLEEAKRRAVLAEDFLEAGRLKKLLLSMDERNPGSRDDIEPRAWKIALSNAEKRSSQDRLALVEELRAMAPAGTYDPVSTIKRRLDEEPAHVKGETKRVKVENHATAAKPASPQERIVPGSNVQQFIAMSNQEIWQHAWDVTWQEADAEGCADDEALVLARTKKLWKDWLAERSRLSKQQTDEETQTSSPAKGKAQVANVPVKNESKSSVASGSRPLPSAKLAKASQAQSDSGLANEILRQQNKEWNENRSARSDWEKLQADVERRTMQEDAPKTGRDLCALVKQRCPADQPVKFERLLAGCPKGTTVRQLLQAMSREPREFRQSWDGTEYCVRPVNSRCVDWLPVQPTTTPAGFRDGDSLPESMLTAAKSVFEERLRPQSQAADDPLAIFLSKEGRLPWDTPLPFADILKRCPPGTQPTDVVRTMSKRPDLFRQGTTGKLFCIKPRLKCQDWKAVNPYLDPSKH
eukprot:TRINITY_DN20889_c0_g1_i1.p1 TRINITY_DN20889_c0_g1~~TRINITY_DN20889_c0_g1_i1.p1  ORF type:complete len:543 (-),score=86.02 TRINITY_DN20889_c0_g1_i1:136-1764(-)